MSIEKNVEPVGGLDVQAGLEQPQGVGDHLQVPPPVVCLLGGEEGQVEVAQVVVDGPPAAPPARQRDARLPHGRQAALGPGVLVAADHHGRPVPPQQQDAALLQIHVGVDPVLQRQVLVDVGGAGTQNQAGVGGGGRREASDMGRASEDWMTAGWTTANTPAASEKGQRPPDVQQHGNLPTQICRCLMSPKPTMKKKTKKNKKGFLPKF